MTLYDLVNDATIQGKIRVSAWDHDCNTETVLFDTDGTDDFSPGDLSDDWEDAEVLYIFCATDGYLHIEIDLDE